MAKIIAFPARDLEPEDSEVDLLTAVDAAIRDLRDIARSTVQEGVRAQAEECRAMLERAFLGTIG